MPDTDFENSSEPLLAMLGWVSHGWMICIANSRQTVASGGWADQNLASPLEKNNLQQLLNACKDLAEKAKGMHLVIGLPAPWCQIQEIWLSEHVEIQPNLIARQLKKTSLVQWQEICFDYQLTQSSEHQSPVELIACSAQRSLLHQLSPLLQISSIRCQALVPLPAFDEKSHENDMQQLKYALQEMASPSNQRFNLLDPYYPFKSIRLPFIKYLGALLSSVVFVAMPVHWLIKPVLHQQIKIGQQLSLIEERQIQAEHADQIRLAEQTKFQKHYQQLVSARRQAWQPFSQLSRLLQSPWAAWHWQHLSAIFNTSDSMLKLSGVAPVNANLLPTDKTSETADGWLLSGLHQSTWKAPSGQSYQVQFFSIQWPASAESLSTTSSTD